MRRLRIADIPDNASHIVVLAARGFERGKPIYKGLDKETGEEIYLQEEGGEEEGSAKSHLEQSAQYKGTCS